MFQKTADFRVNEKCHKRTLVDGEWPEGRRGLKPSFSLSELFLPSLVELISGVGGVVGWL